MSLTQESGPAFSCATPQTGEPGTLSCTVAVLPAGAAASFTLVAHTAADTGPGMMFTNIATASTESFDPNDENNSGVATSTVPADQADMHIGLQAPETSPPGRDLTYKIELGNGGSDPADAQWQDTLPGDATFVSLSQDTGTPFSCTTPAVGAGGTVTCDAAGLAAGAMATFTLVVHIPSDTVSGTEFANQATITTSANDPNEENNTSTTSTTINDADLSVTISAPAAANAGDTLTYTLSIVNAGPDAAASATMVDVLPSQLTFVSLTQTSGPPFALSAPAVGSGGTVSASAPVFLSGATAEFELVVQIDAVTPTGQLGNTVGAAAYEADSDGTDNSATATTFVTGVPPAAPSAVTVSPASPADDNGPRVSGTAQPGSTVRVYATADCSGTPAATGTAAAFASPGLSVAVADDSTTTIRATATDADGTSPCSTSSATYQEDSPPAAPERSRRPDTTKPAMSALTFSRSVFRAAKRGRASSARRRVATRVSFTLSEAATVRFTVQRMRTGRRSAAGRCVRSTPSTRKRRRCNLWPKLPGAFRATGVAGKNRFKFRGRIGGKTLKPGRYRLNSRATDTAGNNAPVKRKRFKIVR